MKAKLAIGPMSKEIVDAAFQYAGEYGEPIMLIASKNQIDYDGGYVNGWTTREWAEYCAKLWHHNKHADVFLCRDHCGPGFCQRAGNKFSFTLSDDLAAGLDLVHIDLCHMDCSVDKKIAKTCRLMEFCLKLNPSIRFEIGTDEQGKGTSYDLSELEQFILKVKRVATPEFWVIQTGSLVMEIHQIGTFDKQGSTQAAELLHKHGIKLKEHNADYLSGEAIRERVGIVDAMNIAPQLGVVQSQTVLNTACQFGIDTRAWQQKVWDSGAWKKWDLGNITSRMYATQVAGHYHFNSVEYLEITRSIGNYIPLDFQIKQNIMKVMHHYVTNFSTTSW